ncbi:MAG TPA: molybdate ABC transporter permease subunit [Thermoleophilia bacterium]
MSVLFPLRLSLQVAVCATLVTLLLGTPLAYVLARKKFRGKEILDLFLTLPMVLPPVVTGYFLLVLLGRNGYLGKAFFSLTGHHFGILFTWYAAVIASFVVSFPFMIKTARASMEAVDQDLINASYTLGRSETETALRVVIPLSGRGIIAGATLAFARAIGEFGATIMVAANIPGKTNTMPLTIYNETLYGSRGAALWMVLLLVLVSGVVMYTSNRLGRRAIAL